MTLVDISILTLKILSAVYRSQEKYGAYLIASSLCGHANKKVQVFGLDKISTFGIVTDMTVDQVVIVIEYCLHIGLLYRSTDHTNLKLSVNGKLFLKNKPTLTIPQQILDQAKKQLFAPKLLPTHLASLRLWQSGKDVPEIASIRDFKVSTVETHLADLVYHHQITDIARCLSAEQLTTITKLHKTNPATRLREIKEQFPDLTYGQIRIALASLTPQ